MPLQEVAPMRRYPYAQRKKTLHGKAGGKEVNFPLKWENRIFLKLSCMKHYFSKSNRKTPYFLKCTYTIQTKIVKYPTNATHTMILIQQDSAFNLSKSFTNNSLQHTQSKFKKG